MMNSILVAPFAMVLLSFAALPGLAPRFWHRRMAAILLFWVALALLLQCWQAGPLAALAGLWALVLANYLPFIMVLLALYALGGGISIQGGPWGQPWGNLLLLVIATLLASVMGTIGVCLLLIHPLLAANGHRFEKRHLVLAFIILAGNAGGALSPLGDPPLLVGFLHGVPFFWPLRHLGWPLLVLAVPVLALCFAADKHLAAAEAKPVQRKLKIRGLLNVCLLAALTAAILLAGAWHPGNIRLAGASIPAEQLALTILASLCILVSEIFTPPSIRAHNRFAWVAMREITILFFAIFATIGPVFALLQTAPLSTASPRAWFWASGIASAVLDAAPTYLVFFKAAGGNGAQLAAGSSKLLGALAAGSVFFGPLTYLGNAPNLMVREIAARRGVKMPGFFQYALAMSVVLLPIYGLLTVLFY